MNLKKNNKNIFQKGSALLLTLFLVSGIMIVAFAGSYIIVSGLRSSGLQYDSSRAYYTAESGAEYSLMRVRKMSDFDIRDFTVQDLLDIILGFLGGNSKAMPNSYPAYFTIGYKSWMPIVLTSTGTYGSTQRSVEISF